MYISALPRWTCAFKTILPFAYCAIRTSPAFFPPSFINWPKEYIYTVYILNYPSVAGCSSRPSETHYLPSIECFPSISSSSQVDSIEFVSGERERQRKKIYTIIIIIKNSSRGSMKEEWVKRNRYRTLGHNVSRLTLEFTHWLLYINGSTVIPSFFSIICTGRFSFFAS